MPSTSTAAPGARTARVSIVAMPDAMRMRIVDESTATRIDGGRAHVGREVGAHRAGIEAAARRRELRAERRLRRLLDQRVRVEQRSSRPAGCSRCPCSRHRGGRARRSMPPSELRSVELTARSASVPVSAHRARHAAAQPRRRREASDGDQRQRLRLDIQIHEQRIAEPHRTAARRNVSARRGRGA